MTREEAVNFLKENSSSTFNGPMVHISDVEETIEAVSDDKELIEKAFDSLYECKGNCYDWVQLCDAKWLVDVALGIKDEDTYYFDE